MKKAPPTRPLDARVLSPEMGVGYAVSILLARAFEIPPNTSGAPFPKAKRVTPAKDWDMPVLTVRYSSDGDK